MGDEFLLAVEARLAAMVERPLQFPLLESVSLRPFRFSLIRRFPYRIVFEVPSADTVIVLAVAHTSRHPGAWEGRLS